MTERFIVENLNIQDNSPKGSLYLLEEQGGVNALCNLINGLNNKSNRLEKDNERLRNTNRRLRKEYDKIYDLCREHFTEEEIIKELSR